MTNQCINGLTMALFIAFAILIILPSSVSAGGSPETEDITGVVWKWNQTRYNNDQQSAPDDPSRYTIALSPDGTLNVQADCNRGGGTYSMEDKRITIEVTHTTRAMCPTGSLDQAFLKDLNSAAIYFSSGGFLFMDLKYDIGTMKFGR